MSLEKQIQQDIKAAMLAKEKIRLESLRAIKSAILLVKTADGAEDISDDAVIKLIQKLVKQRKETALVYADQNRQELADKELEEAACMEIYLPKQMSENEIEEALKVIISDLGASGPQDMGKVMGIATKQLAGKADGRVMSTLVKKLL